MADLLDLVLASDGKECAPVSRVSETHGGTAEASPKLPKFRSMSIRGMVGNGRHGDVADRKLLCFHMRAQKQTRSLHSKLSAMASKLQGSTFKKGGKAYKVKISTQKKGSGIRLTLEKISSKGNRFVRAICFSKFLEAAFSPSCCNIAIAARLEVHPSTIPKLQKTCASLSMCTQGKFLAQLLLFCRSKPPVVAMRKLRMDKPPQVHFSFLFCRVFWFDFLVIDSYRRHSCK